MSILTEELKVYMRDTQFVEPEELKDCKKRCRDTGKNFAVVMMAHCDFLDAEEVLFSYLTACQNGGMDYPTIQKLTCTYLESFAHKCKGYYHLRDTHHFAMRCSLEIQKADTPDAYMDTMRVFQRYVSQTAVWLDIAIPWKGLSEAYMALTEA